MNTAATPDDRNRLRAIILRAIEAPPEADPRAELRAELDRLDQQREDRSRSRRADGEHYARQ